MCFKFLDELVVDDKVGGAFLAFGKSIGVRGLLPLFSWARCIAF